MLDESKAIVRTGFRTLNVGLNAINSGLDALNDGLLEPLNREIKEFSEENKIKHKTNMLYIKSDEFKKTVNNEIMMNHIIEQSEELEELEQRLDGETRKYMVKSINALIEARKKMIDFMLKELK